MIGKTITFDNKKRDDFIDFIKAYCILAVVFCHGFPYLNAIAYPIWGCQIPLFFIIQAFHSYKREQKPINWENTWKRIVIPFICVELVLLVFKMLTSNADINALIFNMLNGGGYGPGSYYPWIYLQLLVLIPLVRPCLGKLSRGKSLALFLAFSIFLEVLCVLIHIPDSIYRLLFFRYFCCIYIGWEWAARGIKLTKSVIIISLLSLATIIYFAYINSVNEPFFYNTSWSYHRWPCYFFYGLMFPFLLLNIWKKIKLNERISKVIYSLSINSYEIFLVQMVLYTIFYWAINVFQSRLYYLVGFIFVFFSSCVLGVLLGNQIRKLHSK